MPPLGIPNVPNLQAEHVDPPDVQFVDGILDALTAGSRALLALVEHELELDAELVAAGESTIRRWSLHVDASAGSARVEQTRTSSVLWIVELEELAKIARQASHVEPRVEVHADGDATRISLVFLNRARAR